MARRRAKLPAFLIVGILGIPLESLLGYLRLRGRVVPYLLSLLSLLSHRLNSYLERRPYL
jgi:hypothetical protein